MEDEILVTFTQEEIERARQISEEKYQLDLQSKVVYAKQKAMQEETLKIARNCKKLGIPVEQIAQATGLTEQQIAEL